MAPAKSPSGQSKRSLGVIEIMFGRLKDWRRVTTRYDRCPKVFLPAIALAAIVIYSLWIMSLKRLADKLPNFVRMGHRKEVPCIRDDP